MARRKRQPNDQFVIRSGGDWVYLAYITGTGGTAITQATVSTIDRLITNTETNEETEDTGLAIATRVFDTAQDDDNLWSETFNFKDIVPAAKTPDRVKYHLQYTFTMTDGSILKTEEIDIEGD